MMFLVVELVATLGLATNTARHVTYREIEQQSRKLLKENTSLKSREKLPLVTLSQTARLLSYNVQL